MHTATQSRLRPEFMHVDPVDCIECGLCEQLAPGMWENPDQVPVTGRTLEAMSACPTGAIRWLEKEEGNMKQIDVRTIPPRERHPLLFRTFDELDAGTAFELVNDHDPKPLYYQFQVERPGAVAWEYLEEGPEVWRVKIGKNA